MDTRADVMFAIIIGTANGLTRPGPFSNNVSYTSWIESIPPIPVPTTVPLTVEPGPFIVVTGHDLHDLKQLLIQTDGKGVNIYTHGEMLPCHAYPELKKHPQLKGNFGTAWQNQQKNSLTFLAHSVHYKLHYATKRKLQSKYLHYRYGRLRRLCTRRRKS